MPAPKGNKYALGNKGGHPSDYKPRYCQDMIEFFARPAYKVEVVEKTTEFYKDGEIKKQSEKTKMVPNDFPALFLFARKIGVSKQTLLDWCKKHEEFLDAYNVSKELQKQFLINNGLSGASPSAAFIFTAKNVTDMRDEQVVKTPDLGRDSFKEKVGKLSAEELNALIVKKLTDNSSKK